MSTETNPPAPRRNVFRRIGAAGVIGIVLMLVAYLFLTSGAFVKSVVLPKVSAALNAEVTVDEVSVGLFSGASLKNLVVRSDDTSLITARSASMKYSFWNLMSGRIRVSEFKLDSPEVYVVQRADNSSNLDPIAEALQTQEKVEKESGKVDLLIQNIDLNQARFRFEQTGKDGVRKVMEAADVKIAVDQFGSGIDGTLRMSTRLKYGSGPLAADPVDTAEATVTSEFKFAFDADLMPTRLSGKGNFFVAQATGALAQAAELGADLGIELDASSIKDLSLRFKQGDAPLGSLGVTGNYDLKAQQASFAIAVADIGPSVLNLAGAMFGMSFGDTTITTKIGLELDNQFQDVKVDTDVAVARLAVKTATFATPPIDLKLACKAEVSTGGKTLRLEQLQLTGLQGGKVFLETDMKQPFSLNWGEGAQSEVPGASLGLRIINFDLAPWSGLSGGLFRSGLVNADAVLTNSAGGSQIALAATEQVRNLVIVQGTNVISGISTDTALQLSVTDLKRVELKLLNMEARHGNAQLLTCMAGGRGNVEDLSANLGLSVSANLPALQGLSPAPGVSVAAGAVLLAGRLTSAKAGDAIDGAFDGKLVITNLSATVPGLALEQFAADARFKAAVKGGQELKLEQLRVPMWLAGQPAGELGLTANANLDASQGTAGITLSNLNERLFALVLNGRDGMPGVRGGRLDAALTAAWDAKGKGVKGDLALADLVVVDANGAIPPRALSLKAGVDARLAGGTNITAIDVPLLKGALMLDGRDAGGFDLSGRFDTAAGTGSFKVAAGGINQNVLGPFVAPALGDKQLKSVSIDLRAQGEFDLKKSSRFNADLSVTNLLVLDPAGKLPTTPLGLGLAVDGVMAGSRLTLKNSGLRLAPTQRAKNELNLSGQVDFSRPEVIQANLLLAAESLDLTPYLDLMPAGNKADASAGAPAPPPAPAPVDTNEEPPPFSLPFEKSKVEARIGKLYLREIEVGNAQIVALLDRQSLTVSPLKMAVNGGAVNGDVTVHTGVPGTRYDLNLIVDHVPIRPALMSFSPTIGQTARGEIVSAVRVVGAGRTGRNLKQTLNGQVGFYITNAMIKLTPDAPPGGQPEEVTFKAKAVQVLSASLKGIAALLRIPDLTQSAITDVATEIEMGGGLIKLRRANVKSSKFIVNAAGAIPIADVLTNSPVDIPVEVWLERTVASRLTLGSGNEPFAKLPQFLTIKGTMGAPAPVYDKAALAQLTIGAVGGIAKGLGLDIGDKAQNMIKGAANDGGNLIKGLGGLLGGQKKQTAPPANTTTNAPPKSKNPFELFKLIPKK